MRTSQPRPVEWLTDSRVKGWLPYLLVFLLGVGVSYRVTQIPSRLEIAFAVIVLFTIPTLLRPKVAVYYLLAVTSWIPFFRRLYYLADARPEIDFLMLLSDGVMAALIVSMIMMVVLNKEKAADALSVTVILYTLVLFFKIFVLQQGSMLEGFYGFKFNGLYVLLFFGGSYLLDSRAEMEKVLSFFTWVLLISAGYGLLHILVGVFPYEQKWLDSINFSTIYIEGRVRPFATFASPAAFADAMCILFLLGIYWVWNNKPQVRAFGIACLLLAMPGILFSTVRSNWGALLATIYFLLFLIRYGKTWFKVLNFVFLISFIGIYLMRFDNGDDAGNLASRRAAIDNQSIVQIMVTNRTQALLDPLSEYSMLKRFQIWEEILMQAPRYPFGKGQGTTGYAHSYYLQMLGEAGFPGIILFLLLLYLGMVRGIHLAVKSPDTRDRNIGQLLLGVLFLLSMLNLTGTHLHSSPGDVCFWFALGCLAQLYRNQSIESDVAFQERRKRILGAKRMG